MDDASLSRRASFTVTDEPLDVDEQPPRLSRRRLSWSVVTSAEDLTFTLHLSASQQVNLHLHNCISAIPLTARKSSADSSSHTSDQAPAAPEPGRVQRKVSLKLARPTLPWQPSKRWTWLLTVCFWVSTAGAAALAAHTISRMTCAHDTGRQAVHTQTRASLDYVHSAGGHPWRAGSAVISPNGLLTLAPDLLSEARYGLAEASQHQRDAVAAHLALAERSFNSLRLHLSPLAEEAPPPRDGAQAIPKPLVAAAGLARAAVQALWAPSAADAPALTHVPGGHAAALAAAPAGFDQQLAMRAATLCLSTYHSADAPGEATALIDADLRREAAAAGTGEPLRLVAEVRNNETDIYALLASNGSALFVAFRGSCTGRNVMTDLDYDDSDGASSAIFAAEAGLGDVDMKLHRGFVDAYRSLRPQLLEAIEAERAAAAEAGAEAEAVVLTGHSMGGALAMLAALDLAHAAPHLRPVSTYTFAAPRLGDAGFARAFSSTFPHAQHHWALQAANDAIPHLPFRAWGFEHPDGVLRVPEDDEAAPCFRRTGDMGDSVRCMRPREGNAQHWATCHDLEWYMARMRAALGANAFEGVAAAAA